MGAHKQGDTFRAGLPPVKHTRSHRFAPKANAQRRQARRHLRRQGIRDCAASCSIDNTEADEGDADEGEGGIHNEDDDSQELAAEDPDWGEPASQPFEEPDPAHAWRFWVAEVFRP